MTSLPLSVWQLSTSSQWQPDECNEWVVTLATAMLSWPSPYILPDSPCWHQAQRTHTKQCTHPHTHSQTLCQTHAEIYTYFIFLLLFYKWNIYSNRLRNRHSSNAHAHIPMLLWAKLCDTQKSTISNSVKWNALKIQYTIMTGEKV